MLPVISWGRVVSTGSGRAGAASRGCLGNPVIKPRQKITAETAYAYAA